MDDTSQGNFDEDTRIALLISNFAVSLLRGEFLSDIPDEHRKIIAASMLAYNAALLYHQRDVYVETIRALLDVLPTL